PRSSGSSETSGGGVRRVRAIEEAVLLECLDDALRQSGSIARVLCYEDADLVAGGLEVEPNGFQEQHALAVGCDRFAVLVRLRDVVDRKPALGERRRALRAGSDKDAVVDD